MKVKKKYWYTKNCIACYKPAVIWSGHVHLYGKSSRYIATSGWCARHSDWNVRKAFFYYECEGCCGSHKRKYGLLLKE